MTSLTTSHDASTHSGYNWSTNLETTKSFPLPCGYCDWLNEEHGRQFSFKELRDLGLIAWSAEHQTWEQVKHFNRCVRGGSERGLPAPVTPPRRGISSFFARLFGG